MSAEMLAAVRALEKSRVYDSFGGFRLYSPSDEAWEAIRHDISPTELIRTFTIRVQHMFTKKRCVIVRDFDPSLHFISPDSYTVYDRNYKVIKKVPYMGRSLKCCDESCFNHYKAWEPHKPPEEVWGVPADEWRDVAKRVFREAVSNGKFIYHSSVPTGYDAKFFDFIYRYAPIRLYHSLRYKEKRHLSACVQARRQKLLGFQKERFLKENTGSKYSWQSIVFEYLKAEELFRLFDFRTRKNGLQKRKRLRQTGLNGGYVKLLHPYDYKYLARLKNVRPTKSLLTQSKLSYKKKKT